MSIDPREGRLSITLQDNFPGVGPMSAIAAANYRLRPGSPRLGPLTLSDFTGPGSLATTTLTVTATINGGRTLRPGSYVLTISSTGVRDLAGNALDGEFRRLPSGNGRPGGDFRALVRVDRRGAVRIGPLGG